MTERTRMQFVSKIGADGNPWIFLDPLVENLTVLDGGFFGFDLPKGTTNDRAREIEKFLNENIGNIHFTRTPEQQ